MTTTSHAATEGTITRDQLLAMLAEAYNLGSIAGQSGGELSNAAFKREQKSLNAIFTSLGFERLTDDEHRRFQ